MINVYIVSGFLGSGKTTFIQKLLSQKKFDKVMLLENEFGEVGVDGAFFDKSLNIKEINNGCICCSLQGDFSDALEEIEDMGVTDLIIEPSGVGKLSEIINVVKQDPDFRIVSHICIVDVKTCHKYHVNFKEYFSDQVACANAIILSHVDVATEQQVIDAKQIVRQINDDATILSESIDKLKIEELLNIIVSGGEIMPEIDSHDHHHHHDDNDDECCCHHHHDDDECCCNGEHHHHHHHDDDEIFKNMILRPSSIFTKQSLENILSNIPEDIIRIKGYVKAENGTLYFNYVLNEYHVFEGQTRQDSLVSIIGTNIDRKLYEGLFNE